MANENDPFKKQFEQFKKKASPLRNHPQPSSYSRVASQSNWKPEGRPRIHFEDEFVDDDAHLSYDREYE